VSIKWILSPLANDNALSHKLKSTHATLVHAQTTLKQQALAPHTFSRRPNCKTPWLSVTCLVHGPPVTFEILTTRSLAATSRNELWRKLRIFVIFLGYTGGLHTSCLIYMYLVGQNSGLQWWSALPQLVICYHLPRWINSVRHCMSENGGKV
jgi:hypothetical protein